MCGREGSRCQGRKQRTQHASSQPKDNGLQAPLLPWHANPWDLECRDTQRGRGVLTDACARARCGGGAGTATTSGSLPAAGPGRARVCSAPGAQASPWRRVRLSEPRQKRGFRNKRFARDSVSPDAQLPRAQLFTVHLKGAPARPAGLCLSISLWTRSQLHSQSGTGLGLQAGADPRFSHQGCCSLSLAPPLSKHVLG